LGARFGRIFVREAGFGLVSPGFDQLWMMEFDPFDPGSLNCGGDQLAVVVGAVLGLVLVLGRFSGF